MLLERRIEKQPGPIKEFCQALASDRTVHAYLCIGARGSGKRSFATEAARSILCRKRGNGGRYCGICDACIRTAAGSHPDLIFLRLEAKRASIGVEDVRATLEQLAVTAYEGGARVVVIEQADKLTPQAQNALLKSLEEPATDVTWFLLATDASVILPTILSRCRQIRMTPDSRAANVLAEMGVEAALAREIAALSGGAAERARELYASAQFMQAREKAVRILSVRRPQDVPNLWQSLREDKALAQDILLWLEGFAADGIRSLHGIRPEMALADTGCFFTFAQWKSIIDEIVLIRKKLGSNVSWNTAVEPLLWKIAEGERE